MKKTLLVILAILLITIVTACSTESVNSQITATQTVSATGMGSGSLFDSIHDVLTDRTYNPDGVVVVVGSVSENIIVSRMFGDVRTLELQEVLYGDVTEINLSQMYDNQLLPDQTYLLILSARPTDIENEYEVAGFGSQCAFWIEDGVLHGNDAALVAEINTDIAAQAYSLRGTAPNVNTMDGLADYFTARLDALETTE